MPRPIIKKLNGKKEDLVEISSRQLKKNTLLQAPNKWLVCLQKKLTNNKYAHLALTKHFDGIKIDNDTMHLDNNPITRVVQLLGNNSIAK